MLRSLSHEGTEAKSKVSRSRNQRRRDLVLEQIVRRTEDIHYFRLRILTRYHLVPVQELDLILNLTHMVSAGLKRFSMNGTGPNTLHPSQRPNDISTSFVTSLVYEKTFSLRPV